MRWRRTPVLLQERRRPLALFLRLMCSTLLLVGCAQRSGSVRQQATRAWEAGRWTRLPLFDGRINALLVDGSNAQRTLYAGTDGGVFKSEDQSSTWTSASAGLTDRLVRSLLLDPRDPRTLYAGTWNGRVKISTDGAASWQDRSRGLPPQEVRALAVDSFDPLRRYAGLPDGVFVSSDGGGQWLPGGRFAGTLQCMAVDPEDPGVLYVGTVENGLFKSVDSGSSWFALNTVFTNVAAVAIPPRSPGTVYSISLGKVYRTEDGGAAWAYVDAYRDPAMARCLAVNPRDARQVYVGLADGLYKSLDARQSWARSDAGLAPVDVSCVAIDPVDASRVYASSGADVFVSSDAGLTWQRRSRVEGDTAAAILALAGDPKHGSVFYASTAGGGLYKTTDAGEGWKHIGDRLPLPWITALAVEPIDTQVVYAGTQHGLVFRSSDGGASWESTGGVAEASITALVADSAQPERIYAGTEGLGLFRSDDAGLNWAYAGDEIGFAIQRILIPRRGPQSQVYVSSERGVFRSEDAGRSWSAYLSPVAGIAADVAGTSAPVVITLHGDNTIKGDGLNDAVTVVPAARVAATGAGITALTSSPAQPGVLYVLAGGRGAYRSTDLGVSWSRLGTGLEAAELRTIALSPDDPALILVGTDSGLFRYQP